MDKKTVVRARETWPLFPAAAYLLAFLIVVLVYLVGLSFSSIVEGKALFPTLNPVHAVLASHGFREALANTFFLSSLARPLSFLQVFFSAYFVPKLFPARFYPKSFLHSFGRSGPGYRNPVVYSL